MKRKRYYIIWCILFGIVTLIFAFFTYNLFIKNIEVQDYFKILIIIIGSYVTLINFRNKFVTQYINNNSKNYNSNNFVDRETEFKEVIHKINTGTKKIYISGRIGIGKTLLLYKLNDAIINGNPMLLYPNSYSIYIDTKENLNLKKAIEKKLNINVDLNYPDILKEAHKLTKSKNIIFLIDNTDDRLYLEMEEFIDTLINLDDNIIFVIASNNINSMYKPIYLSDFTEKEIIKIANIFDVHLDNEICNKIMEYSGGLPIIIILIIKQLKLTGSLVEKGKIKLFINEICNNLKRDQQELIYKIAFYSLAYTEISFFYLKKHVNICTKENIKSLFDCGLIEFYNNIIIMNDYYAIIIRELYEEKRFEICEFWYNELDDFSHYIKEKLIFLLNSNFRTITDDELIAYLSKLIENKEYQLLIYLFELLEDFQNINYNYDNRNVRIQLIYGYTHSLFELGEYIKARDYINNSEVWYKDINLKKIDSKLEFNFNFDLADMDHFFGDFENAINSYMIIRNYKISKSEDIKCLWAIGHCFRHMGDYNSMNTALNYFTDIINDRDPCNYTFFIRAYQSIILIKLYFNDVDYKYEEAFNEMIEFLEMHNIQKVNEIKTSRQYALYLRIILHKYDEALLILKEALINLEKTNIRIKYDYYFELAETLRHKLNNNFNLNDKIECLQNFERALDFADKSGDISLKTLSRIGIILVNILYHKTTEHDLEYINKICDFCQSKKITYILNYALLIKEYLSCYDYTNSMDRDNLYNEIINKELIIM